MSLVSIGKVLFAAEVVNRSRQELLRALANVRDRCQSSIGTDAETEHVRMMIGINEGFISSVALCPSEAPHKEVAKAEGAPAAPQAHPRQCLHLSRVAADRHALTNSRCSGTTVLAVIETQAPSGTISCKAYTVETRIAVPGKDPLAHFHCLTIGNSIAREENRARYKGMRCGGALRWRASASELPSGVHMVDDRLTIAAKLTRKNRCDNCEPDKCGEGQGHQSARRKAHIRIPKEHAAQTLSTSAYSQQ